jgi:hypothetical protein
VRELRLVGVALWRLPVGEQRIGPVEAGVADVLRVRRVVNVELHVAGVPVGNEHRLDAVDLLDHDVVVVHDVAERALVLDVEARAQIVLSHGPRRGRIRDLPDVDVGRAELGAVVVGHDDERPPAVVVPHEGAVRVVHHLGSDQLTRGAGVPDAPCQQHGVARVGDVPEIDSAGTRHVLGARQRVLFVVDREHVPRAGRRIDGDDLSALAVAGIGRSGAECHLPRLRGIRDVYDEDATAPAGGLRPRVEVREVLVDRQIGDLLGKDGLVRRLGRAELCGRAHLELADQLDVLTDGR